jgi:predicted 3-demethylubiquinone-9 3-methyltransferase (glyoxalase superfamily)
VFPNSRIEELNRATDAGPGEPGSVLSGSFVLDGTRFIGRNVQIGYTGQNAFEAVTLR